MKESKYVMELIALYEDKDHIFLVTEYLRGGTLESYLSKFPSFNEEMIVKVFK